MRFGIIAVSIAVALMAGIGVLAEEEASIAQAKTAEAGNARPAMDPALGAIRVSSDWKKSVVLLVTEQERTMVELPELVDVPYGSDANWVPPEGYGKVGLWTELPPGRYVLIVASPGKQLVETGVDIIAGKEVWVNADLKPTASRINVSHPVDKIGPTWHKPELLKANIKWREVSAVQRLNRCAPGSG